MDTNQTLREYSTLVKRIAGSWKRRLPANVELDDLIQVGMIGLYSCIDKYDPNNAAGANFASFASKRIHGSICDHLRDSDHLSRRDRGNIRGLGKAKAALGENATREELADFMGIDAEKLAEIERTSSIGICSIEHMSDEYSGEDYLSRHDFGTSEDVFATVSRREGLAKGLAKLTERERFVLERAEFDGELLRNIGQEIGISESRVAQIRSKAIHILREAMA